MPELEQLLDTLVSDASAGTHAPGATAAIKRAQRRRSKIAGAAAVAVLVAGGGAVAAGILGDDDPVAPIGDSTPASPELSPAPESATAAPGSPEFLRIELRKTLAQAVGWAATDDDPLILGDCAGEWSGRAGGSGGSFGIETPGEPPYVWGDEIYFDSSAEASAGVARLVRNLESCTTLDWRTRPVGQTGAVLAYSAAGVAWIQQDFATVGTLQIPTSDGPPPVSVQVEVAELLTDSIG